MIVSFIFILEIISLCWNCFGEGALSIESSSHIISLLNANINTYWLNWTVSWYFWHGFKCCKYEPFIEIEISGKNLEGSLSERISEKPVLRLLKLSIPSKVGLLSNLKYLN